MYVNAFPGTDEVPVEELSQSNRDVFVMMKEGVVASFVVLRKNILEYLLVNEKIRGKGIGSYTLERLVMLVKRRGESKIYLECLPHLISYYQRFGGKEMVEGKRKVYNSTEPHAQMVIEV